MIYNPFGPGLSPLFVELRRLAGQGARTSLLVAAADFVHRENKPWQYYAGVLLGGAVAAVGSPGASLGLYASARALDVLILKSPEGHDFDIFVDGIGAGSVSTYAADTLWDTVRIVLGAEPDDRRVEFRSRIPEEGDGWDTNWMAFGAIWAIDGLLQPRPDFTESKPWTLTLSIQDAAGRKTSQKIYLPYFATPDEVEAWLMAYLALIQPLIDGQILDASLTRSLDLLSPPPDGAASIHSRVTYTLDSMSQPVTSRLTLPTWDEALVWHADAGRSRTQSRPAIGTDDALRACLVAGMEQIGLTDARGVRLNRIRKSRYQLGKRG